MMTTNAGAEVILNNPEDPDLRNKVMRDLRTKFRDSFLNRFDAVSLFKPFSDAEFLQLAHNMVNKKVSRIKSFYDWTLTVDAGTFTYISIYGKSREYGARPMERLVEGTLGIGIAEYQLEFGAIEALSQVHLTKLTETHKFRISVGENSVEYSADAQSLQSFFRKTANSKLFTVFDNKTR